MTPIPCSFLGYLIGGLTSFFLTAEGISMLEEVFVKLRVKPSFVSFD